jgi:hypothetical protein
MIIVTTIITAFTARRSAIRMRELSTVAVTGQFKSISHPAKTEDLLEREGDNEVTATLPPFFASCSTGLF